MLQKKRSINQRLTYAVWHASKLEDSVTPLEDSPPERTIMVKKQPLDADGVVPDVMAHYLVMVEGAEPGKRVEIDAVPITIGRDAHQTLAISDAELSRRHASVSLINGNVVVEDLQSTNGTFIDGKRVTEPSALREGSLLRLGHQYFKYERRGRRDVERAQELDRELRKASLYVLSLLPTPLESGAVRTEWRYVPSTQLGGDAFGYYWLDPDTFVFYLVDVSGHGVGSAMHSVSVLNVLRQRALPGVDFRDPAGVLASLNARFPMFEHNGLFFTMWYGVYATGTRTLSYGCAGHHAAYLVAPGTDSSSPLGMPSLIIGMFPDSSYEVQQTTIPPGSALYLFSDGAFEIVTKDDRRWGLSDFLPLLCEPKSAATPEAERIYAAVRQAAAPGPLEDDFSLMVVTFP